MEQLSRREFLLTFPRYLIAGILGGGAVWLWRRGKTKGQKCTSANGYCKQCSSNSSCSLPSAISFREVTARRNGND